MAGRTLMIVIARLLMIAVVIVAVVACSHSSGAVRTV